MTVSYIRRFIFSVDGLSLILVESIALSKAGDLLATASRDKTVRPCKSTSRTCADLCIVPDYQPFPEGTIE